MGLLLGGEATLTLLCDERLRGPMAHSALPQLASDIELRTKELEFALKPAIDRLATNVSAQGVEQPFKLRQLQRGLQQHPNSQANLS